MIYILQVKPGEDSKVRAALEREGITAFVPRRELIIRKNGGWTKAADMLFPGYVFVECDYSAEMFHKVKAVDGVLKWLGKPTPIVGSEEKFMRLMFNEGCPIAESRAEVDGNGNVTVTGGWLEDKQDFVTGFNIRKKRAYLQIRFGGKVHRTSVGMEFTKE